MNLADLAKIGAEFEHLAIDAEEATQHAIVATFAHMKRSIDFLLEEMEIAQPDRVANLRAKYATQLADAPEAEPLTSHPAAQAEAADTIKQVARQTANGQTPTPQDPAATQKSPTPAPSAPAQQGAPQPSTAPAPPAQPAPQPAATAQPAPAQPTAPAGPGTASPTATSGQGGASGT